jgi:hypothetical protein
MTEAEQRAVKRQVTKSSTILAMAVAKLLLADPNSREGYGWEETGAMGCLCLIINRRLQTVVFRIYDIDSLKLTFETEVYHNIELIKVSDTFHAFELETHMAGLQYADAKECRKMASKFNTYVTKKYGRPKTAFKPAEATKSRGFLETLQSGWTTLGRRMGRTEEPEFEVVGDVMNFTHQYHVGVGRRSARRRPIQSLSPCMLHGYDAGFCSRDLCYLTAPRRILAISLVTLL